MTRYTNAFKDRVSSSTDTLGTLLAKESVRLNVSVDVLQKHIGASKQTFYNWFRGGNVTRSYRHSIEKSLEAMANATNTEEALANLCQSLPPIRSESTSFSVLQKKLALMKTGTPYKKKSSNG